MFFIALVVVDDERNALVDRPALGDMRIVLQITPDTEAERTPAVQTLGHATG